jgi:hypothetical protein
MRETASITGVSLSTLSTVQDQTKLLFFDFISAVADTKTAKDTLAESAASLLAKISENTGAAARVLDDEGLRISDTESVDLIVSAASADATNSNLWKFLSSDKKGGDYLATIYNTVISPKSTLGKLLSGGTNFTANLSGLTFADVMQTSGNLMDVVWGSSVDFSATAKKLDVDSFLASTSQGLYDAVVNGKTSFDTELGSVDISALTEQEKALIIDGKGDYTATVSAFFTDADLTAKQTKTLFSSVSFTKSLNLIKGKTWTDSIVNVLSNASATNGYSYSVDLVLRDLAGDSILSFSKQGMATAFERLIINTASAASALNKIASTAFPALDTTNFGSIYNSYEVPAFASGGNYAGGLALVGEQGPELINFDSPGRVYTAQETSGMLSGVNSPEVVGLLKQVISDGRVNAQALANVMLRVARLLEKWEGFGIPETRTI